MRRQTDGGSWRTDKCSHQPFAVDYWAGRQCLEPCLGLEENPTNSVLIKDRPARPSAICALTSVSAYKRLVLDLAPHTPGDSHRCCYCTWTTASQHRQRAQRQCFPRTALGRPHSAACNTEWPLSKERKGGRLVRIRVGVERPGADLITNGVAAWQTDPPPHNRRRNPNKSANKLADRFFGKTASQCPGSQSQGPITLPFWLLSSWSHVETQNISEFSKKKKNSSPGLYMVPDRSYGRARWWSSGIYLYVHIG